MPEEIKKPKSDVFLEWVELASVAVIALSLGLAAIFVGFWIAFGFGDGQKIRLATTVSEININWKIGILLLVPLFYRTMRGILKRMTQGPLGIKFHPLTSAIQDPEEEIKPQLEGAK